MGYCCTTEASREHELGYNYEPKTLNGKTYSARQIFIIVRIQCAFRQWLARRKVQALRDEYYAPGMHRSPGEDFENVNVQVSHQSYFS